MTTARETARMAIAEQAAEWYLRNREGVLDDGGRQAFQAWVSESPAHVEEYLAVTRLIALLPEVGHGSEFGAERLVAHAKADNVVDFDPGAAVAARPVGSPRLKRSFVGGMALVAASLLIVVGSLAWWDSWKARPTVLDYSTDHGVVRAISLPDRSLLQLDSDSRVTVRYARDARQVDLLRGQAYIEVTPDRARPFEVLVGAVHVRDVGTHFNVYRREPVVEVTVLEGAVRVESTSRSTIAMAGQQATTPLGGGAVILRNVNAEEATAWRSGRLVFRQRPLFEVVGEFNRYSQARIEIDAPDLASMPVSGVISTQDITSFMAFLNNLPGVKVAAESGYISVTRDK